MPKVVNVEERRREIAYAVWRVVQRAGLPAASMREIARQAGCTTGALTHHFADRRELLDFSLGLAIDESTRRVVKAAATGPLEEALAELLPLDDHRRAEGAVWLVSISAAQHDPDLAAGLSARYAASHRMLRQAVRKTLAGKGRRLPAREVDLLVDEVITAVDGIAVYALADPARYPPARQRTLVARVLARVGLADA
jgi:AcrR family transcriptional regulator